MIHSSKIRIMKRGRAFQRLMNDIDQLEERMNAKRAASERLKIETAVIVAGTRIIKAHIEENLARLEETVNQLSARV